MNDSQHHAIVAGDIIGSSRLPTDVRRRLNEIMTDAHDKVADAFGDGVPYPLAVSAGDEWRMYVEDPPRALAASIAFWTQLKARNLKSRMVLAIGTIDFIEDGDLHRADGSAFRSAGRSLHSISEQVERFGLFIPVEKFRSASVERAPIVRIWAETTSELTNILLTDLTSSQARAVAEMICGTYGSDRTPTQREIAERWEPEPVTVQTVSEHLQRARWPAIERTISRFESFWKYV